MNIIAVAMISAGIPTMPNVIIMPMKASNTTWPATMFANSRIVSANGLVNFPINSIGESTSDTGMRIARGTSCGQKMIVLK
ncbi:hypothetical protein D3C83_50660 [compost metagenome]